MGNRRRRKSKQQTASMKIVFSSVSLTKSHGGRYYSSRHPPHTHTHLLLRNPHSTQLAVMQHHCCFYRHVKIVCNITFSLAPDQNANPLSAREWPRCGHYTTQPVAVALEWKRSRRQRPSPEKARLLILGKSPYCIWKQHWWAVENDWTMELRITLKSSSSK